MISLFSLLLTTGPVLHAAPVSKPNFVIILADDMGWGDLGAYNPASKIPTPRMDKLAAESQRFLDAHSPSGVCTPTRYGLLTGRYSWRGKLKSGVLQGYAPVLIEPDRPTLASHLKKAGYATCGIGKWHLGLQKNQKTDYSQALTPGPLDVGFDSFFGIAASLDMPPYAFIENRGLKSPLTGTIAASKMRREGGGGFWREGALGEGFTHEGVLPELHKQATAFLDKQQPGQPFLLYLPLTGPHTPWMPTPEFRGKSKAGWYGDFVCQVDSLVGSLLDTLKARGLANNTVVILTSDNGGHWKQSDIDTFGHLSNASWRGQKADIHEGGHRVPLLVRWPDQCAPGLSHSLVCLTDIPATCASLAGIPMGKEGFEDSISFASTLLAGKQGARTSMVHHSSQGMFAYRKGPWKVIEGLGSGGFTAPALELPQFGGLEGQLYHLIEDPCETRNRWASDTFRAREMLAEMQTLRDSGKILP